LCLRIFLRRFLITLPKLVSLARELASMRSPAGVESGGTGSPLRARRQLPCDMTRWGAERVERDASGVTRRAPLRRNPDPAAGPQLCDPSH